MTLSTHVCTNLSSISEYPLQTYLCTFEKIMPSMGMSSNNVTKPHTRSISVLSWKQTPQLFFLSLSLQNLQFQSRPIDQRDWRERRSRWRIKCFGGGICLNGSFGKHQSHLANSQLSDVNSPPLLLRLGHPSLIEFL